MTNNVLNYFEQPGADGDNKLVLNGTVEGIEVELGAETQFNTGGDPEMVMAIKDGDNQNASLVMANDGFGANPAQGGNTIFGCFAGTNTQTSVRCTITGLRASNLETAGDQNSTYGESSGFGLTASEKNSFFGALSGQGVSTGECNTFIGQGASALPAQNHCISIGENSQAPQVDFGMNIANTIWAKTDTAEVIIDTFGVFDSNDFGNSIQLDLRSNSMALRVNRMVSDANLSIKREGMIWYNTADDEFRCFTSAGIRTITTEAP